MTRRRTRHSRHAGSVGQSLAEFALVAPIFFLLVFAVIQIGIVLAAQNGLVDGVRSAARRAATYRINEASFDSSVWPSICQTIKDEISTRLSDRVIGYNAAQLNRPPPPSASPAPPVLAYEWEQNPESGDWFLVAHVSASYANPLYVPLVSFFLDSADGTDDNPDELTLTASEQMRVENPALDTPASTAPPC